MFCFLDWIEQTAECVYIHMCVKENIREIINCINDQYTCKLNNFLYAHGRQGSAASYVGFLRDTWRNIEPHLRQHFLCFLNRTVRNCGTTELYPCFSLLQFSIVSQLSRKMQNHRADRHTNWWNNKTPWFHLSSGHSSPDTVCLLCAAWGQPPFLCIKDWAESYQTPKQENAKMRKRKGEREGGREERAFTAVVRQCFLW